MTPCPVCQNPAATWASRDDVACPDCGKLIRRACCSSWLPLRHQPTCRVLRPRPATLLAAALAVAVPAGLLSPAEALPLAVEEGVARACPGEVLAVAVTTAGTVCHAAELLAGSGRDEHAPGWLDVQQEARALALSAVEQLRAAQARRFATARVEA